MQLQAAGLWPSQPLPPFIEDVFSTYLYTGNGSTQTITNNINITGKGALVWLKIRSGSGYHIWTDTARGAGLNLSSNVTIAQYNDGQPTFNSNGFNLINNNPDYNASGSTYASWTFRKQPKFFDIVTYTGNGTARDIAHNLGSVPGCMIVKGITQASAGNWNVYHTSVGNGSRLLLNDTTAAVAAATTWNNTSPTSTQFTVGTSSQINASGETYVAYLFAHNAGGFGLTETDNVISCGSYTGNGSATGPTVNLGYEPQWVMTKRATDGTSNWIIFDNMRGLSMTDAARLLPNGGNAESSSTFIAPTSTGFRVTSTDQDINISGSTYIYIAIRRGPMAVPTVGTSVFAASTWTGSTGNKDLGSQTAGFGSGYLSMLKSRTASQDWGQFDQLRGSAQFLSSTSTSSEGADGAPGGISVVNNKLQLNTGSYFGAGGDGGGQNYIGLNFRRAPNFFDEVCYTGTNAVTNFSHNLTVAPELIIIKRRNGTDPWPVGNTASGWDKRLFLDTTAALVTNLNTFNNTAPTSTVFTLGVGTFGNESSQTYVAYLFATCAGVSKVGSYTGTGAAQTINCGFTSGARFVLIKRTDSTGDWNVWDSARGIIPANDPYLALNSTATEVTGTDYVDTTAVGFDITSTAPAAINANGGTFIFLAIA
jgi:hypothetical protein